MSLLKKAGGLIAVVSSVKVQESQRPSRPPLDPSGSYYRPLTRDSKKKLFYFKKKQKTCKQGLDIDADLRLCRDVTRQNITSQAHFFHAASFVLRVIAREGG